MKTSVLFLTSGGLPAQPTISIWSRYILALFLTGACLMASAQMTETERQALLAFANAKQFEFDSLRVGTEQRATALGIPLSFEQDGEIVFLKRFNRDGIPVYIFPRNAISQQTISVDEIKTGGSAEYTLSGAGEILGIWDGTVRISHQEFGGRASYGDSPGSLSYHGTHVAGTIAAGGVDAAAQGMSHAADLLCHTSSNATAEMATAAAAADPIIASNHSYGPDFGWIWNSTDVAWSWQGPPSPDEDWQHGAYLQEAVDYDQTAFNAPYYLIVVAAGNENGSGTAGVHQHGFAGSFTDYHPIDGGANGYDCLPGDATAKNVLTVGNCLAIPGGYTGPGDVVLAGSSSRGPVDDSRIKPDVVTQGTGVYSCMEGSDADYGSLSGTSMAAPAATGTIGLLAEHWRDLNGPSAVLRSATYKALLIHTADEAGPNPGPDYHFGWGLVNARRAAQLLALDASISCDMITESQVGFPGAFTYQLESHGNDPLRVTLVWTDPAGTVSTGTIDDPTPKLVNDLDLRLSKSGTTWYPWKLNAASPTSAATTGDNLVDNVEQILIGNPAAGTYTVSVSAKGALTNGPQEFSLIITGHAPAAQDVTISSGTITTPQIVLAQNTITVNGTTAVGSGGHLQTSAGESVTFGPDFTTSVPGQVTARIETAACVVQ